MQERIVKSLAALFEDQGHRIVVWQDTTSEHRESFEAVALDGVEKIEVANTEFRVKHRILREAPKQKFLIYRPGPLPADADNWLLDVELAHQVFKADKTAMWLAELGLPLQFEDLVRDHQEFFKAKPRVEKLKGVLQADDTKTTLRHRMLGICAGADGGFDTVVEALLGEHAAGKDDSLRLIGRAKLDGFLWDQMAKRTGYRGDLPSIADFAITLFKSCWRADLGEGALLSPDARLLFGRWKDDRHAGEAFATLSAEASDALGLEAALDGIDFRRLIDVDYFEAVDKAIISALVREVAARVVAQPDVAAWLDRRRRSHWYETYRNLYEAIGYAAELLQLMAQTQLGMAGLAEGVQRYVTSWYRIDQLYRKYVWRAKGAGQATLLGALTEQIENHYVNSYLVKLNEAWQAQVDKAERWVAPPVRSQREFYNTFVGEFRRREQKVAVIISDALRYEIADELAVRIRKLDRYETEIEPMLGCLPSYTQLGMAALLPNEALEIADDSTAIVIVDGQSSQGLENRKKILANGRKGDRATALKSEEVMGLDKDAARALFKDHDVVYVYHNQIDAVGDKRETEANVFDAVEDALEDIEKLVKKLAGANFSNLIVTADHGFIYQHRPIEESDFSSAQPKGETILVRNRRFVLGHALEESHGLARFTAGEADLDGTVEMLIPKSINRLRLQGSGSRFVHGGSTLQEIVVPVVKINKKRQSDTDVVEVELVASTSQLITAGQISVRLYQTAPVTAKVRGRQLRVGIYAQSGELISDRHVLDFSSASENARDREQTVKLTLTQRADAFNKQDVVLKLEERHGDTSHFREYRWARYTLRRSFTSDFDF